MMILLHSYKKLTLSHNDIIFLAKEIHYIL